MIIILKLSWIINEIFELHFRTLCSTVQIQVFQSFATSSALVCPHFIFWSLWELKPVWTVHLEFNVPNYFFTLLCRHSTVGGANFLCIHSLSFNAKTFNSSGCYWKRNNLVYTLYIHNSNLNWYIKNWSLSSTSHVFPHFYRTLNAPLQHFISAFYRLRLRPCWRKDTACLSLLAFL